MKQFKGTPGPWTRSKTSPKLIVRQWLDGSDGYLIGSMCGNDNSGFYASEEECEANLNLAVAAPELLEALRQLRDYVEDVCAVSSDDCHEEHPLMLATSAIAKAIGERETK